MNWLRSHVFCFPKLLITKPCGCCLTKEVLHSRYASYLFSKGQPNKPIYKPALDIDSILQRKNELRESIRLRKCESTPPIDFEKIEQLYADYKYWDAKENAILLEIDRHAQDNQSSTNENHNLSAKHDLEALRDLSVLYRDKVVSIDRELHHILLAIPNFIDSSVTPSSRPKVLEVVDFDGLPCKKLSNVLEHDVVAENLKILRQKTIENVTTTKGFYLSGAGCYLERALIRYTEDYLASLGNFTPFSVPLMLSPKVIEGCGQPISDERSQIFKLDDQFSYMNEPLFLAGTSEHSLIGYLMKSKIPNKFLPLRMTATSPCFRAELTEGRRSRGIFRVPQFNKVEMVGICVDFQSAESLFDEFVSIQKELFASLRIPHRVIEIPADDLGLPAYRKIDIEAYMPGRKEYGEISSCSNCTDYQSRRLHIRHDKCLSSSSSSSGVGGDAADKYVHTINGTACATPRLIAAILENYQQADGSVAVPDVLQSYMPLNCREVINAKSNWRISAIKQSKLSFKKNIFNIRRLANEKDSEHA